MVDLAERAFGTNNFGLAAEIYERAIKERGPSSDLYLGLADCFARERQFQRAFDAYSSAFRQGSIPHHKLSHLVTALVDVVTKENIPQVVVGNKISPFFCQICYNLLSHPVTIPCGHTFCRRCLQKDQTNTCKKCGVTHHNIEISGMKTNVLLSDIVQKWFPIACHARELKEEANNYLVNREFEKAIGIYGEAIQIAPTDHLLFSNRSYALACIDRFDQAVADADHAIQLKPDWPKAYFRKASALVNQGRYQDAIVSFLQCLALDGSSSYTRTCLSKALHKFFSVLPPDDPKALVSKQVNNPTLLQDLIEGGFHPSLLMSQVELHNLSQLRNIVSNTTGITNLQDNLISQAQSLPKQVLLSQAFVAFCFSAPSSRSSSPMKGRSRSRSYSPASQNTLKRKRISADGNSLNPNLEPPKHCKLNNTQEKLRVSADLINREDFDCALCYRLIFQPVTTPCGHAFCRQCLDRCLDHRSNCPLCKFSLVEYLADGRRTITECLDEILVNYLTEEYENRKKNYEEEVTELARMCTEKNEIPLFICTLAYPTLPCPLHIFEPRYRLMIRQCIESGTRQFGMCVAFSSEENCSNIGCMLEIRDLQSLPDGRSLVDTVGGRRFRILSKGTRDGYTTAKVQFFDDSAIPETEIDDVKKLQNEVYTSCDQWLKWLPAIPQQLIRRHFGDFPQKDAEPHLLPNGPSWVWWMVAVLPLDPQVQLMMLAKTNLRERLLKLQRVLGYIKRHQS
ncbi:hypothetical protein ScPMuIL_011482 [Solemya velum]